MVSYVVIHHRDNVVFMYAVLTQQLVRVAGVGLVTVVDVAGEGKDKLESDQFFIRIRSLVDLVSAVVDSVIKSQDLVARPCQKINMNPSEIS